MKLILVLLLVSAAVLSACALTEGEKTALQSFLSAYPVLGAQTPPWNTSVDLACTTPTFYGVGCSYDGDTHVTSLKLNGLNMIGSIPAEISGLEWLEVLSLEDSCLSNALSPELYQLNKLEALTITDVNSVDCASLKFRYATLISAEDVMMSMRNLTIAMATLGGRIPMVMGEYPVLERLSLSSSFNGRFDLSASIPPLGGQVPSSFSQLRSLKSLRLENTHVQGFADRSLNLSSELEVFSLAGSSNFWANIDPLLAEGTKLRLLDVSNTPASFTLQRLDAIPSLQYLYARSSTNFNWHLPSNFWSLFPNIRQIQITNAAMTGRMSSDIGNLKQLELLDLSGSSIGNTIPLAIGDCSSLETLILKKTRLYGPIPETLCQLSATLRHLEISDLKISGSTIPDCFGDLTRLETLVLSSNGLKGTIPRNFRDLPNLNTLELDNNGLDGDLPELLSHSLFTVDLHNNRLTNHIPTSIASKVSILILANNFLSGDIPSTLFIANQRLETLDISHNFFSGALPRFSPGHVPKFMIASRNMFEGAVPAEYCEATSLELPFNQLTSLSPLLNTSVDCSSVRLLSVGYNLLQEDNGILNFTGFEHLRSLSLQNNRFTNQLPWTPFGLEYLDASHNRFKDTGITEWRGHLDMDSLTHLDLSSNWFAPSTLSSVDYFGMNLEYLSLAHNDLSQAVRFFPVSPRPVLAVLDLTNTSLGATAPDSGIFPNLIILKIAHNNFQGDLRLTELLSATQLDISFNRFEFDVSLFSAMPLLISLIANNNKLYGTLVLDATPNLQSANFSSNALDHPPDLTTIGSTVRNGQLRVLDISSNPIPTISNLETAQSGLDRTSSSAPSVTGKSSVCYGLSFWNLSSEFAYSEDLFGYQQCECAQGYFGAPPFQCMKCPAGGTTSCSLYSAVISPGAFMFLAGTDTFSPPSPSSKPHFATSILQNLVDTIRDAAPTLFPRTSRFSTKALNLSAAVLETESCLVTTVQTLSKTSNCQGALLSATDFNRPGFSLQQALDAQCAEGSTGRLCSKCVCEPRGNESCWFLSGAKCAKCRHVFALRTSIPILCVALVIIIIVMSIIMAIVLKRRRIQHRARFAELSLFKRVFYRLMYLKTLGNLPIVITFLQTLIAFTGWDASARLELLNLLNGKTDGLGLRCFFPILADPLWAQLAELSVPFVLSIIVAISVVIGGLAARFKFKSSKSGFNKSSSTDEHDALLTNGHHEVNVEYPTLALLSSLVITVIKFFYFGTALTAHQYLFSTRQVATGVKYIQFNPWMKSSEAWTLIVASFPAIIIFDLIIPASFIFICWRVRNTFHLPSVRIYYGSIFETYRDSCFWWEIVNTLKKFLIAFVLKALPATDALQSALIVSILSGVLLIQLSINPWKRKVENLFDSVSSLLLIGALIATRPGILVHLSEVVWYMWVLSVLFVVASVGILVWQTITGKTEYEKVLEEFEERNMLDGHIHAIVDGNMTDSWNLLDAPTNS